MMLKLEVMIILDFRMETNAGLAINMAHKEEFQITYVIMFVMSTRDSRVELKT